jgi:two-component system, LuxR family, response regulator FixJ
MNSEEHSVALSGSGPPRPARERCRNVYIVDDDAAVCDALALLLESKGYTVKSFTSARSLLAAANEKSTGVLILDLYLPDMSGLALQAELRNRGIGLKTIFISGHGDIGKSVQAIRGGAVDFIEKPYTGKRLLNSVEETLLLVNAENKKSRRQGALEERYERLTSREREIMNLLVRGITSRKLAEHLGLSSRTVEIHRSKIMHKLEVASLPELVRMVYTNGNARPEEVLIDIRQSLQFQDDQKTG